MLLLTAARARRDSRAPRFAAGPAHAPQARSSSARTATGRATRRYMAQVGDNIWRRAPLGRTATGAPLRSSGDASRAPLARRASGGTPSGRAGAPLRLGARTLLKRSRQVGTAGARRSPTARAGSPFRRRRSGPPLPHRSSALGAARAGRLHTARAEPPTGRRPSGAARARRCPSGCSIRTPLGRRSCLRPPPERNRSSGRARATIIRARRERRSGRRSPTAGADPRSGRSSGAAPARARRYSGAARGPHAPLLAQPQDRTARGCWMKER